MDNIFQRFYAFSQIPLKRVSLHWKAASACMRRHPAQAPPAQALREHWLSSWPARVRLRGGEVVHRACIHVRSSYVTDPCPALLFFVYREAEIFSDFINTVILFHYNFCLCYHI